MYLYYEFLSAEIDITGVSVKKAAVLCEIQPADQQVLICSEKNKQFKQVLGTVPGHEI